LLLAAAPALEQTVWARPLMAGCLQPPTAEAVSRLAASVGAKAYAPVRRQRELKTTSSLYPEPASERDQRTRETVTAFVGWDLAGPGAGNLEYLQVQTEADWVDRASGQALTGLSVSRDRVCQLTAPVANARAIFELYEGLTIQPYGIRISADRLHVHVFIFDPDQYDIELSFTLNRPLAGLPASDVENRLVMPDGGPRFINDVIPGIQTVTLSRSALLAGLDQPAQMGLLNEAITPVVQRLASAR
jgi:hypothetical protein